MLMDISTFLSKVGTEYPILLTAELLVLVTLALVAALFRRLLPERNFSGYICDVFLWDERIRINNIVA